jgi:Flp pilus assembly pilin Flp
MTVRRRAFQRPPARTPRRTRTEKGAVALEFALILPVLAILLLGTVSAGITYSHGIGLSNAVREGARFGATTGISPSPLTPASWNSTVVARVRATQFDSTAGATAICVRLWKGTAAGGAVVLNTDAGGTCDQGTFGSPALAMSDPAFPAVPASGLTADSCVVQVLAAQKYSITLGILPSLTGTMKRGAVARYERTC